MSLYRRGRIWWCKWQIGGQRVAESTGTEDRQKAQEYHDRRRAAIWDEVRLGKKPARTWDEAALDWWTSHASKKKSAEDDRLRLRRLTEQWTGKPLEEITQDALNKTAASLDVSDATKNRYLAVASAVLRSAHRKGWLHGVPTIPYLGESKGRYEWLERNEAGWLLAALPVHLAALARFSLATGLRRHNATHLEWSQIDLERRCAWIWGDEAKSGKPLAVPLNSDAMAVLEAQKGKHFRWVFPYRGKPVHHTTTKAWKRAVAKIGRPTFTWHGLRHTWASWHVMAGTPLEVLQRLGGWHSLDMVMRYAHLAPGFVAPYADRITLGTKSDTEEILVSDYSRGEQGLVGWTMGLEPTTTGITILSRRKKSA